MKSQQGFTLLELMVAMAIFAMLAVAGWQVFDGVSRARERAQFHADNLAVLQYAYLQLQQDMGQIVPYQAPNTQSISVSNNSTNDNNQQSGQQPTPDPFMSLDGERVSFVRFADPDPRYQSSASVQHVEYIFADERLIRRQYTSIGKDNDSIGLDSVLLEGVTAGRWQAYLPEMSTKFPNKDGGNSNNTSLNSQPIQGAASANTQPEIVLLPKGVAVSFTYQDMPITWQWALTPQPLPNISINTSDKNTTNNPNGNTPNNNTNNNGNNGGGNNNNDANSNIANNNSGNASENSLFGQ